MDKSMRTALLTVVAATLALSAWIGWLFWDMANSVREVVS